MATSQEVYDHWTRLTEQCGGAFDLRIYLPQDLLIACQGRVNKRELQFIKAVGSVIGEWEKGTRTPCMGCGEMTTKPLAVVVMMPDTDEATQALGGVLCRACVKAGPREARRRVLAFLKAVVEPGFRMHEIHHDAGRA